MSRCYYSYMFDLEDGLIMKEALGSNNISPMRAVGCEPPIDFDDYVEVWKNRCYPIFKSREEERKLTRSYFRKAYEQGSKELTIDVEHNPLKNTYYAKNTRVKILFHENEETKKVKAVVRWEDYAT